MIYTLGEVITTKKPHACGGNKWEITRLGIDIGIKCLTCNRQVLMFKSDLDKRIKRRDS